MKVETEPVPEVLYSGVGPFELDDDVEKKSFPMPAVEKPGRLGRRGGKKGK